MSAQSVAFTQPKNSFPFMLIMSISAHIIGIILILVLPDLLPAGKRDAFGGPSGGGMNVVTVDFGKGRVGKPSTTKLAQSEPAPPKQIKKITKPDEVELESKTTLPDPDAKKKPENEPTEKETLNQKDRKMEGPFGKGTDTAKDSGKSGNQGSGQFGLGTFGAGGVGEGGFGTGTGKPFPFPWYIENVLYKIELNWVRPYVQETTPQDHIAVVFFVITRAGQVRNVKVENTSGISTLDRSAESAILNASPFPPLPAQWPEPDLAFRVTFSYTR